MEVNWLTVLNTVLNVEVWIKGGTWRREEERDWSKSLCFFSPPLPPSAFFIYHMSGPHNRNLPTGMFSLCWDLVSGVSKTRIFPLSSPLSSLLPAFYFFLPSVVFFPCHIPSRPFCCLPGFIRQQWGWKLHFSWNVSCCEAPAGVIFFFFFILLYIYFFPLPEVGKHRAAFAALHVCKSEQRCTHLLRPARWCV